MSLLIFDAISLLPDIFPITMIKFRFQRMKSSYICKKYTCNTSSIRDNR